MCLQKREEVTGRNKLGTWPSETMRADSHPSRSREPCHFRSSSLYSMCDWALWLEALEPPVRNPWALGGNMPFKDDVSEISCSTSDSYSLTYKRLKERISSIKVWLLMYGNIIWLRLPVHTMFAEISNIATSHETKLASLSEDHECLHHLEWHHRGHCESLLRWMTWWYCHEAAPITICSK